MKAKKVAVRNNRLRKVGLLSLFSTGIILMLGMVTNRESVALLVALPNFAISIVLLLLANRFRAVKLECKGKTLLLIPDYTTSTIILQDSHGRTLAKDFFPVFEKKRIETPCGTLEIIAIRSRFGKVKLRIKAENREITLP